MGKKTTKVKSSHQGTKAPRNTKREKIEEKKKEEKKNRQQVTKDFLIIKPLVYLGVLYWRALVAIKLATDEHGHGNMIPRKFESLFISMYN